MSTPATTSLACKRLPARTQYAIRNTAIILACILTSGCTRTVNRAAERRIRDVLPQYIGNARVWRAHVENPPERTIRGKLSRITIDGEAVDFGEIIRMAGLHIDMRDATFDVDRKRLTSVASTAFETEIDERDLNDYLRKFPPPDQEPVRIKRVWLRPGSMYAEGTRWALGKAWPFTATSKPALISPTRVKFDVEKMSVVGLPVPLPAAWLSWLSHRLSQGFDFTTLPFPVRIESFKIESGRLTLTGTADVMQSLNSRLASKAIKLPLHNDDVWQNTTIDSY